MNSLNTQGPSVSLSKSLSVSVPLSVPLSFSQALSFCLWKETMLCLLSITPSLINFSFNSNSNVHLNSFLHSVKEPSLSVQVHSGEFALSYIRYTKESRTWESGWLMLTADSWIHREAAELFLSESCLPFDPDILSKSSFLPVTWVSLWFL